LVDLWPYRTIPLSLLLLVISSAQSVAAAQDPQVTFYSEGSSLTSGLPGAKHGIFNGVIFDGQQRIALIRRHRFLTLRFSPGQHVFSASYKGKHPAENSQFPIVLEEGKHYFIRAESESSGVLIVEFEKGRLEQVSCETAHKEAEKISPVVDKDISSGVAGKIIQGISLPPCH